MKLSYSSLKRETDQTFADWVCPPSRPHLSTPTPCSGWNIPRRYSIPVQHTQQGHCLLQNNL